MPPSASVRMSLAQNWKRCLPNRTTGDSMSRNLRIALLAAAALAAATPKLHAQAKLSIAAGASAPTGAFGEIHDLGYHVLVGLRVNPPVSPVGFRLEGMFNEF